ncbi:DUF3299 domain-containing protein [Roseibium sediminicola]|uniref:DUF3299 domain-containing protein n=1 Tax=Roseibium sediminicola TaxID=2933272 RepID=A0ABT0GMJ4_9HYPH|nr:DUF3299 domain-containing protein [Roseibium sp. CAU 1639]MCK7610644.1 DUF3299 domain-containing protein [Roseibium sp. CAU 1639]
MRLISVWTALILSIAPASATQMSVSWSSLVDQQAQTFEDPFKALSVRELSDLSTVERLRKRLESDEVADEARPRLVERLRLKENGLKEAGIDPDWLLSQRWAIAEKRKTAAWAVNAALDGRTVELRGYLLVAGSLSEKKVLPYLVPELGMCSHTPPPAPNNLVQLKLPSNTNYPEKPYAFVEITGTLHASPDSVLARVVDGQLVMASAWAFKVDAMNVITPNASEKPAQSPDHWPVVPETQ